MPLYCYLQQYLIKNFTPINSCISLTTQPKDHSLTKNLNESNNYTNFSIICCIKILNLIW